MGLEELSKEELDFYKRVGVLRKEVEGIIARDNLHVLYSGKHLLVIEGKVEEYEVYESSRKAHHDGLKVLREQNKAFVLCGLGYESILPSF